MFFTVKFCLKFPSYNIFPSLQQKLNKSLCRTLNRLTRIEFPYIYNILRIKRTHFIMAKKLSSTITGRYITIIQLICIRHYDIVLIYLQECTRILSSFVYITDSESKRIWYIYSMVLYGGIIYISYNIIV